jgi:RHS repeat-associated protein
MQTTTSGVIHDTGLTTYIGSIEEVQVSSGTTGATTTTYYAVGGKRVAANVNGTFYYFGYDALGSQVAVFNNSGNLIGSQLYGPYGDQRYSNGTLPTTIGFTGQQTDSVTGLDYYNARYYDPAVGQFLSADTVQGYAGAVLHTVIFTQLPPCSDCRASFVPDLQKVSSDITSSLLEAEAHGNELPDEIDPGQIAFTLDVFGSKYVPQGSDTKGWKNTFYPGTTDVYGVQDYWNGYVYSGSGWEAGY